MEELYTGDAFGNELSIGDTVVAATQIYKSPAIKMGKIVAMSQGKPYEAWDFNDGKHESHKVAKWRINWFKHPKWTYSDSHKLESTVHGLNLYKVRK